MNFTDFVDVEGGDEVPASAVDVQLGGEKAEDLDGVDEERHADGQPGEDLVQSTLRTGERSPSRTRSENTALSSCGLS